MASDEVAIVGEGAAPVGDHAVESAMISKERVMTIATIGIDLGKGSCAWRG